MVQPKIEESWKSALEAEFSKPYFHSLKMFLQEEKARHTVFPPGSQIFSAFNLTPFNQVKVVILGQDPYHGPGQAHGLCFSVPEGVKVPPSLQNIYKEIERDLNTPLPRTNGNLEHWAKQGVLLLNAVLTVRAGAAGSHQQKGWELFTDAVIQQLSAHGNRLVFLLWGRYAAAKEKLIDATRHHVLKAAHPSPLSAYNGFFGCCHFSRCNQLLAEAGKEPVNWTGQ